MKCSAMPSISRSTVKVSLMFLSLVVANALVFAQQTQNSKPGQSPKPTASEKPAATPKASPTPETKIDAKTEAELLQAEDRFVIAIENRDVKALDELLHPSFADSVEGRGSAITKRGFVPNASRGSVPAYRVEKERKLTRSGNLYTVEGLARDMFHDGWETRPAEWVHVRRLWEKQGDRWIATAQIITPEAEHESEKEPKEKEKK